MNKIIVICGFSGSGKDTIAKYISEHFDYKMIISTTSRPMRADEQEGNPYHFVSADEFQRLIDENKLIEHREYHTTLNGIEDTWYYGIERKAIGSEQNYVVVLDLWGLCQFKKCFDNTISFFIDVPNEDRKCRAMLSRADFDIIEWDRRLADDRAKFTEKEILEHVNFRIPNLELHKCIEAIMEAVNR